MKIDPNSVFMLDRQELHSLGAGSARAWYDISED
jgi:hypothetical protein